MYILFKITKTDNQCINQIHLVRNLDEIVYQKNRILKDDKVLKVECFRQECVSTNNEAYRKLAKIVDKYAPNAEYDPEKIVNTYYNRAIATAYSFIEKAEKFYNSLAPHEEEIKYTGSLIDLTEIDKFISKYINTTVEDIKVIFTKAQIYPIMDETNPISFIEHNYDKAINIGKNLFPKSWNKSLHAYSIKIRAEKGVREYLEAIDYILKCGEKLNFYRNFKPFEGGSMSEHINKYSYEAMLVGKKILEELESKLDKIYHENDTYLVRVAEFIKDNISELNYPF